MSIADAWFVEIKRQTGAGLPARMLDTREMALATVLERRLAKLKSGVSERDESLGISPSGDDAA